MVTDHDNPEGAAPVASEDLLLAATLRDFVPHARAAIVALRDQLAQHDPVAPAAADLAPGLDALASQFDAFELLGAARVCRAAGTAAVECQPGAPFGEVLDEIEWFVERLALDPLARFDDHALLVVLETDPSRPIDCCIGGEFEADADDFLSGMRDELVHLGRMLATGSLPSSAEIVEARQAASGIAGVAASLDLGPLVELARAIALALQRDSMTWSDIDELGPVVDLVRRVLDGLGGEHQPAAGELLEAFAALARFGAVPPEGESTVTESPTPVSPASGPPELPLDAADVLVVTLDGSSRTLPAAAVIEVLDPATAASRDLTCVDLRSAVDPADELRAATATAVVVGDPAGGASVAFVVDGVGEVVAAAALDEARPLAIAEHFPLPSIAD